MAKAKILFECQACGYQSAKFLGKCPNCGAWESFLELNQEQIKSLEVTTKSHARALPITAIEPQTEKIRTSSGSSELDLVLGGGLVEGSLVLIGGSPGVGKSTLLLAVAGFLAKTGEKVLYVAGEESGEQIRSRAERLNSISENLYLLPEINLEAVLDELNARKYTLVIIDSIQTLYSDKYPSAPGSVGQVREITFSLMRQAKATGVAIFIIGHITKEGSIAGPRVLEHMVDTVLYFDGESHGALRILRGFKNRFGATSEIGLFEMTEAGLISAKNFGRQFLTKTAARAGSAITILMEGSRPLAVEVQALVAENNFGAPRRSTSGFDSQRLTMLLALLERKLDLPFGRYDVFINIVGGVKISETSADLAVVAAILSSFRNRPLSKETVFIGEVSLTGDIRDVSAMDMRLKEALAQGFEKAIISKKPKDTQIKCFEAQEVSQVIEWM
ncbi:MAG: hypothetical protein RL154_623 [Pseudomonadota bacterium]|jgi:DNA repair protein RadA/Sms